MTNRKWTRIITLASASVGTLCLGAWLSYEAAMQQRAPAEHSVVAQVSAPQPSAPQPLAAKTPAEIALRPAQDLAAPDAAPAQIAPAQTASEQTASAQTGATLPDAADESPRDVLRASLPGDTRSLFADAEPGVSVTDPSEAEAPVAELSPQQPEAAQADAAQTAAVASEKAQPDELGPIPAIIPLPTLSDRSVPVEGVPTPPRRPVGLAAAQPAPTQVASLGPVALPMSSLPPPQLAPTPQAAVLPQAPAPKPAAAAPKPVAAQPAAPAASENFPNIGNALAAVTASVGGANATLGPQLEAVPAPEPVGGFKRGAEVYVRIFKREGALELWMKKGERFALYKTYPICKWSGHLGPKQAYADYQSPEGFYEVSAKQLNPHSHYHLAFDVGYPNAYDRRHGFSGDKIMVHGDCQSVGCFAMTNAGIDEIYGLVASALASGQKEVPVHIFPFRMTEAAIVRESGAGGGSILAFLDSGGPKQDWSPFWRNLKEGYDQFERTRVPPTAYACGDRYEFSASAGSCARIAGR